MAIACELVKPIPVRSLDNQFPIGNQSAQGGLDASKRVDSFRYPTRTMKNKSSNASVSSHLVSNDLGRMMYLRMAAIRIPIRMNSPAISMINSQARYQLFL